MNIDVELVDDVGVKVRVEPLVLNTSNKVTRLIGNIYRRVFSLCPRRRFCIFTAPFGENLLRSGKRGMGCFKLPLLKCFGHVSRVLSDRGVSILFHSCPARSALGFPLQERVCLVPSVRRRRCPRFFSRTTLGTHETTFTGTLKRSNTMKAVSRFTHRALVSFPSAHYRSVFLVRPTLRSIRGDTSRCDLASLRGRDVPDNGCFVFPTGL